MNTDRFRFRVWDKAEQHYLLEGSLLDGRTGKIAGYFDDYTFSVEQCTGLKDKNGTLIFEGDVVKCNFYNCKKNLINQVVWWKGYFRMMRRGIVLKHVYEYYNIEVIGNVHEYEKGKKNE